MKKRIRNLIGTVIMTAAIVFSMIQLNTPVVRAIACPDAGSVGCNCTFQGSVTSSYHAQDGWHIDLTCYYSCMACGGSGWEPMYIEQTVEVHE